MSQRPAKVLVDRVQHVLQDESRTAAPELAAPAAPGQMDALERCWGCPLPPSYRDLLELHDGDTRLWFDVRLLSSQEIIDHARSRAAEGGPLAGLGPRVFARSTESDDVLTFEPSEARGNGEIAVVHRRTGVEVRRWASFDVLVEALLMQLWSRARAEAMTTQLLWTNLWRPDGSSPDSRGFVCGRGGFVAGDRRFFGGAFETTLLGEAQRARVDRRFESAIRTIETTRHKLAIVLTDAPAEETASGYYVYYEPCAHLVIALDLVERRAAISAATWDWDALGSELRDATTKVEAQLERGQVIEALEIAIDQACTLAQRMRVTRYEDSQEGGR